MLKVVEWKVVAVLEAALKSAADSGLLCESVPEFGLRRWDLGH